MKRPVAFRRPTGQFDYQKMAQPCVCGHLLGDHGLTPGTRRCLAHMYGGEDCGCAKFRPKKTRKKR